MPRWVFGRSCDESGPRAIIAERGNGEYGGTDSQRSNGATETNGDEWSAHVHLGIARSAALPAGTRAQAASRGDMTPTLRWIRADPSRARGEPLVMPAAFETLTSPRPDERRFDGPLLNNIDQLVVEHQAAEGNPPPPRIGPRSSAPAAIGALEPQRPPFVSVASLLRCESVSPSAPFRPLRPLRSPARCVNARIHTSPPTSDLLCDTAGMPDMSTAAGSCCLP